MTRLLHAARLRLEATLARHLPGLYLGMLSLRGRSSPIKLLLVGLVRPGDVVFDVGANQGIFTALLSNLVGPRGRVHAFEPSPATCDLLRATLAERALDPANVVVNASAAGAEDGAGTLYTPRADHGQASLKPHEDGSWSGDAAVQSTEVRVTSLDSYVAALAPARLDLIKMDVEGAELPALRGFAQGLRALHPLLVCEICGGWTRAFGYRPTDVIDELTRAGYDAFYLVTESGGVRALESADAVNDGASRDLVAIVSALHAGRVKRLVR